MDVPAAWIGSRAHDTLFVVQATGDCLYREGIVTGSFVLCERLNAGRPPDGSIVVVRVGSEITMKRWFSSATGVELRDSDDNVAAALGPGDDVELLGVAFHAWRGLNSGA